MDEFGIADGAYTRMDTERLIWEHDKVCEEKKRIEAELLKHGITV